ncbi:hypothetical protein GQX74_000426 [Glossina fuscipes]|nr:hypothetical protein GQX74_000426 [Glossina fuscipes]
MNDRRAPRTSCRLQTSYITSNDSAYYMYGRQHNTVTDQMKALAYRYKLNINLASRFKVTTKFISFSKSFATLDSVIKVLVNNRTHIHTHLMLHHFESHFVISTNFLVRGQSAKLDAGNDLPVSNSTILAWKTLPHSYRSFIALASAVRVYGFGDWIQIIFHVIQQQQQQQQRQQQT